MSLHYGDARTILAHHRAIEAHVAAGGIARIRGTFAEYDATSWTAFKSAELDRRINEKGALADAKLAARAHWRKDDSYLTDARRDAHALRDHFERRVRLPYRFSCADVQARLGHLCPLPDCDW